MGRGITRQNDSSTGHDACPPSNWTNGLANSVFANGKAFGIIGTSGTSHGCNNHSPHSPTIISGSATVFATKKAVARKFDNCNCGDKVNIVSSNVFAD